MKIGTFSTVFGSAFLVALWLAGINEKILFITALVILGNTVFQIVIRGNVPWMEKPNYSKINEIMPVWVYTCISSIGLIIVVLLISKATLSL